MKKIMTVLSPEYRSLTCPICGELLDYEEVDIGVGTQRGHYWCSSCGWYPERDDEDIWSFEHEEIA